MAESERARRETAQTARAQQSARLARELEAADTAIFEVLRAAGFASTNEVAAARMGV
ncbi:MAG: hypothetical protein GY910_19080 [bacterium]|nr:hypothetical protein [bacterium]